MLNLADKNIKNFLALAGRISNNCFKQKIVDDSEYPFLLLYTKNKNLYILTFDESNLLSIEVNDYEFENNTNGTLLEIPYEKFKSDKYIIDIYTYKNTNNAKKIYFSKKIEELNEKTNNLLVTIDDNIQNYEKYGFYVSLQLALHKTKAIFDLKKYGTMYANLPLCSSYVNLNNTIFRFTWKEIIEEMKEININLYLISLFEDIENV